MENHKGLGFHLIFITISLVATTNTCLGVENISFICSEQERIALLNFKQSVKDPSGMLSSWVGNNCCTWERIGCDHITGNVESVHLEGDHSFFYGNSFLLGDEVNPSLAELRHLKYLDLSGNDFGGSRIPNFIGSFKQLAYLNLSYAGFNGIIPPHVGNLTNLNVLDLSWNEVLMEDDMTWTFGLLSLQHLNFNYLDLSGAQNWDMMLYMIPSLKELSLSSCKLSKIVHSHSLNSSRIIPNIKHLDLSFNYYQGPLPGFFQNMTSLTFLDLSTFNLSFTNLLNMIPSVSELHLTYCGLDKILIGPIPESVKRLRSLLVLDVSDNMLTGPIPTFVGSLVKLDLSLNQLNGPIPTSLGSLVSLQELLMSSNLLNGTIPVSFGQLSKLHSLDLSYNSFEGVVSEAHFANLSMLRNLDTSYNSKLTFNVSREWIPPFQLLSLHLSSCNILNGFPQWLQNQRNLEALMLSNATISGTLPTWLRKMPIVPLIDLSHNKLNGPLTNLPNAGYSDVSTRRFTSGIFLQNNLFNDSIPMSLCRRTYLELLDLSRNRLSGKIPMCLANLEWLGTMIFSSNQLSGVFPSSIALKCSVLIRLNLNDNKFTGKLPRALGNLQSLVVLDLGDNQFSGNIPESIGENLTSLLVLRLHKNNLTGSIPQSLCKISKLHIFDVAYNNLTGTIPHCLGELNGMVKGSVVLVDTIDDIDDDQNVIQSTKGVDLEYTTTLQLVYNMDLSSNNFFGEIPVEITALSMLMSLNLSNNLLSGGIPDNIGKMTNLESLDFSNNQLSEMIPPSMVALNFLSHLNLSNNNLSGRIPTGNQLQTLTDPSIYAGNKDLCGFPVIKNCSNHEEDPTIVYKKEPTKVWLFYVDIMSGFATGFLGVIGVLFFKKKWRRKLFMFVEETMDKIYVVVVVRVVKMKRGRETI
ncbi:hypothetical protein Lser_V15G40708 [Lactuca serriola]